MERSAIGTGDAVLIAWNWFHHLYWSGLREPAKRGSRFGHWRSMPSEGSVTKWIRESRHGDSEAIQNLWNRYFRELVSVANRRLRGRGQAVDGEDVALSALAAFFRRHQEGAYSKLKNRAALRGLLATIAMRRAFKAAAKAGRLPMLRLVSSTFSSLGPCEGPVDASPPPEFIVSCAEQLAKLLDKLPADVRKIVELRLDDLDTREIAGRFGCTQRSVQRKLTMARAALAEMESEYE